MVGGYTTTRAVLTLAHDMRNRTIKNAMGLIDLPNMGVCDGYPKQRSRECIATETIVTAETALNITRGSAGMLGSTRECVILRTYTCKDPWSRYVQPTTCMCHGKI